MWLNEPIDEIVFLSTILSEIVGVPIVFQQKPWDVMGVSPNEPNVALIVAVVAKIEVTTGFKMVANPVVVVKLISPP